MRTKKAATSVKTQEETRPQLAMMSDDKGGYIPVTFPYPYW
ncbi:hypothetical protein NB537_10670 [Vibrio parahaemolyticus]|nr:hypothetical protein [Vibrio parahaemolyticus]MCR9655266.1 hypothetical protein [Vibrio parahaemolyticus]